VAVYETHLGGEYDATNIISAPVVTAITSIEMDHVSLLGPDIQNIAWHKAGILKAGSLAFPTVQQEEVTTVLNKRAVDKGVMLTYVDIGSVLPADTAALKPTGQRSNCSLALAVVRAWLIEKVPKEQNGIKDDVITQGIMQFSWPGRFQQINDRNCQWFLDGAHNESSLPYAVRWFAQRYVMLSSPLNS